LIRLPKIRRPTAHDTQAATASTQQSERMAAFEVHISRHAQSVACTWIGAPFALDFPCLQVERGRCHWANNCLVKDAAENRRLACGRQLVGARVKLATFGLDDGHLETVLESRLCKEEQMRDSWFGIQRAYITARSSSGAGRCLRTVADPGPSRSFVSQNVTQTCKTVRARVHHSEWISCTHQV
jgi:hypothetical protein